MEEDEESVLVLLGQGALLGSEAHSGEIRGKYSPQHKINT